MNRIISIFVSSPTFLPAPPPYAIAISTWNGYPPAYTVGFLVITVKNSGFTIFSSDPCICFSPIGLSESVVGNEINF